MKHKIVVAGCGGMSNAWLDYPSGRKDAEIVGLVDIFEESAKAMVARAGVECSDFYRFVCSAEGNRCEFGL